MKRNDLDGLRRMAPPVPRRRRSWARLLAPAFATLLGSCALPGSTPIAYHAITLDGHCAETEEDGFRENATLKVNDNQVQALQWQLWVGRQGSCSFHGQDFRQTQWRPQIELAARDGSGCKLMIWRDDRRITLAHAGCEARCTPGIYESAWPVMFDPAGGGCAQIK